MNGLSKWMKIRDVVKLRQTMRKCRKLASVRKASQALAAKILSSRSCRVSYVSNDLHFDVVGVKKSTSEHRRSLSAIPPDVPSGHLAVYVGQQCNKRFVIRAAYLNHPVFRALLEHAKEEFGYAQPGGLAIPCDEFLFEHILRLFSRKNFAILKHLDLEAVKSNFCSQWRCSSEVKGVLSGKGSRALLHPFAQKSIG